MKNTLHLVVKGKGNLPVFAAPSITWPDSFTAFDPTAKEEVNKNRIADDRHQIL